MSRIQQLLDKAEREGAAARTRGLAQSEPSTAPNAVPPATPPPGASVDVPGGTRSTGRVYDIAESSRGSFRRVDVVPDPMLVSILAPQSPAAEQYRALRTRLAFAEDGRMLRTIMVTSPGRGDGKTLTTLNLALTIAQEFQRQVVLVDADLHRPSVHTLLGVPQSPGLVDVLAGAATLDDVLVEAADYRLVVVPAGSPSTRPAELLGSPGMRALLADLRSRFDRVLIDTPPAGVLADADVLAPAVDGVVVVVRAGRTPRSAIERLLAKLAGSRLLGLVLNDIGASGRDYAAKAYIDYQASRENVQPRGGKRPARG